jgi:hypothetical protein
VVEVTELKPKEFSPEWLKQQSLKVLQTAQSHVLDGTTETVVVLEMTSDGYWRFLHSGTRKRSEDMGRIFSALVDLAMSDDT